MTAPVIRSNRGGMRDNARVVADKAAMTARLRTHCGSQKMTVAAMQMADMKVWAQRS